MRTVKRWRSRPAAVLPVLALTAALVAACGDDTQTAVPAAADDLVEVVVEGLADPLRVEVADTPERQSVGLSGRSELPEGTGMLFTFDEASERTFWMKDTLVPLSIAWIRDGAVLGVDEMTPCTAEDTDECPLWESPGEVDAALEAAAGTFADVADGARVTVRD